MKRSREFIFDSGAELAKADEFYSFDFFDHDLILFCDRGLGYRFKYEDLRIIGGRSASPCQSNRLSDVLALSEEERRFFVDFLGENERNVCLMTSKNKIALVFNRLFHSCGLGMVAIFNYPPECAASAISHGLLDRLGERIYSTKLIEKARGFTSDGDMEMVYSMLKLADLLMSIIRNDEKRLSSRMSAASAIIGCGRIDVTSIGSDVDEKLDTDSLASMMLCLFSLCRRLSVDRSGALSLDGTGERVKISFSFETADIKPSASDFECVSFCERLALKLEMPLSIELADGRFYSEFVPFRVDPSLYGLKAGVNIVFR